MIDVIDVSHHFGLRPVLRHVNARFEPATISAIMGPNGSGKSTLMQIMAGLISPVEGTVHVNEIQRRKTPEGELAIRKLVAYLPAEPWLPGRTPRTWMKEVGKLYDVSEERLMEHIPRLLALFNLDEQADEYTHSLSTGQQKKTSLATIFVTEAPVLLLDEPFAGGLDPSGAQALKRLLLHLRTEKKSTIVMSTPVPELVEELADRIALLRDGQIIAFDTIEGLRKLAAIDGNLDQIYERVAAPSAEIKIHQYFKEESR